MGDDLAEQDERAASDVVAGASPVSAPSVSAPPVSVSPVSVQLKGGDDASGLANMLHQYIAQNIEDSPKKQSQARSLRGTMVFRAAEDVDICVRITFERGRIMLEDTAAVPQGVPSITADFLTVAHLTTGERGPFGLLLTRKMRVRFSPRQMPFLHRALRFMQVPMERDSMAASWKWWLGVALLGGAMAALIYWFV